MHPERFDEKIDNLLTNLLATKLDNLALIFQTLIEEFESKGLSIEEQILAFSFAIDKRKYLGKTVLLLEEASREARRASNQDLNSGEDLNEL